jgi:hypothetical protein
MEEKRNKNCLGHKFCTNQIKPLTNKKKKIQKIHNNQRFRKPKNLKQVEIFHPKELN